MSVGMEDGVKRWTEKRIEAVNAIGSSEPPRGGALVIEIIQGKTTVAEASRSFDLSPSEIEGLVEDAKRGMEISEVVRFF